MEGSKCKVQWSNNNSNVRTAQTLGARLACAETAWGKAISRGAAVKSARGPGMLDGSWL